MPMLYEQDQVGKRESLADLIAVAESTKTPFTSMIEKRKKPGNKKHDWQVKAYPDASIAGVLDGQDATVFVSNARETLTGVAQKVWWNPAVSDFAEESEVAGARSGEFAEQIADALVVVKRIIEKRCLSASDCQVDDGTNANETRGAFSWLSTSAQSPYPVPAAYRPSSSNAITGTMSSAVTESAFTTMMQAAYKERKGPTKMTGIVGIELKQQISNFAFWQATVSNFTSVRMFNQAAENKALIAVVDKLVMDTGEVDLLPSSFLYVTESTGAASAYTHKSGIFVDPTMWGLAYTRLPRVVKLPYEGGGYKAIVDAIFMLMCDNPLGQAYIACNA